MAKTDFEKRLGDLGEKIDTVVAEGKEATKEQASALRDRWHALKVKMDEVDDSKEGAWEEAKTEFEKSMNEMESSYENLKKEM